MGVLAALAIVLSLLSSGRFAAAGFRSPELPRGERGVYRFDAAAPAPGVRHFASRAAASFRLTVGFRSAPGEGHRERAKALLDALSRRLRDADLRGVSVSVERIYPPTREIVLRGDVESSTDLDRAKGRVLAALRDDGVLFAGEPAVLRVE